MTPNRRDEKDWQAPPFTATPRERIAWVDEVAVGESEAWMKGQAGYNDIPRAINLIQGKIDNEANETRSDLSTNHTKFAIRKMVATLADVKEIAQYDTNAKYLSGSASTMNKTVKAVSQEDHFPARLKMALQYMSITGKGYIWPKAERKLWGNREVRFNFWPMGLLDVLPVQLPADNNIQGAYATTLIVYMPVWEAHARFPRFQSQLLPIARRRYSSTVTNRRLDLAERFRYGDSTGSWASMYCEIRYTFINDLSINTTGQILPMGEENTSWFYLIPSWTPNMSEAETEKCYLYPTKRLMITSKGMRGPMYDGPSFDWHGLTPVAEYCADAWPWEASGFSLVRDVHSAQRALGRTERGIDQVVKARLDPSLAYDRNAGLNDSTALTLDPWETRGRLGVDGDPKKVLATVLPEELLDVPGFAESWIKYLKEQGIDAQLGLNEISNLAEFKASLNSEAVDKALTLLGPIVKDISYGMSISTQTIGEILKYSIPQYLNTRRIMQYTGPDGVDMETFDFDPESLIPSHMPDEAAGWDGEGDLSKFVVSLGASRASKIERARMFCNNLRLIESPEQMHEIPAMQEQLKYLQLYRSGAPIAFHDVAKKLHIKDYGEIEGNTGYERWVNEQKQKLELAAEAQKVAAGLGLGGDGEGQEPGTGPKGGQKGTGGRAPSGQKPPNVRQKGTQGGTPRTTVTES